MTAAVRSKTVSNVLNGVAEFDLPFGDETYQVKDYYGLSPLSTDAVAVLRFGIGQPVGNRPRLADIESV